MTWDFFHIVLKPIRLMFEWLRALLNTVWLWVLSLLAILFAPVLWILDLIIEFQNLMITQLNSILTKVTGLMQAVWSAVGALGYPLGLANAFIPVTEIFAALTFLFVLWVLGLLYRLIKSWIPTVS
jgi:hypothetical protein